MTATPRHTADSITDDALDALYAERDRLAAALGTEPQCPAAHAPRPQERPGAVRAVPGMPKTPNAPQTGAQPLTPDEIADLLDEFIADAKQRGADPAWLRGARCITGRLRLADPAALGDGRDCPACDAGMPHTQCCPTPETHNAGCVHAPDPGDGLRDRIAAALREHYLATNRDAADADGNLPCRCGDWREPGSEGTDEDDWDAHLADVAMTVRDRHVEQLAAGRETWRRKAEEIERDRDRLAARIRQYLDGTGTPPDAVGLVRPEQVLAELRARLVAQHKGAMSASAASSGDPALIHDGERMGLDVAVAELDALALRYANTPPAR